MSPEDTSWSEYRLMILDWHNQDLVEKREIRERLEAHETKVTQQLTDIQTTLAEIRGARKLKVTLANIVVPAVVALVVLGGEALVQAFIK